MTQWTDELITFEVEGEDMTTTTGLHITFRQGDTIVDKTDATVVDASNLAVWLTQEETGRFRQADVLVQLNYFDETGKRKASNIGTIPANSNLLKRILHHG